MTSLDTLSTQFSQISRLLGAVSRSLTTMASQVDEANESAAQDRSRLLRQNPTRGSAKIQTDVHTTDRAIAMAVVTFQTIEEAISDLADEAHADEIVDRLRKAHVNLIVLRGTMQDNADRLAELGERPEDAGFASQVALHASAMITMGQALRLLAAMEAQNPLLLGTSAQEAFGATNPASTGAESHRAIDTVDDLLDAGQNILTAVNLTMTCLDTANDTVQVVGDLARKVGYRTVRTRCDVVQAHLGTAMADADEATALVKSMITRVGEMPTATSTTDLRELLVPYDDELGRLGRHLFAVAAHTGCAHDNLPARRPGRFTVPEHKISSAGEAAHVAIEQFHAIEKQRSMCDQLP